MTTLQTRLAQADKPTRELLEEVWEAIHGECETHRDVEFWLPFAAMLDAEAWTSAVEMLVPEASEWELTTMYGIARATVDLNHGPDSGPSYGENACGSPALALAIACLKARGL